MVGSPNGTGILYPQPNLSSIWYPSPNGKCRFIPLFPTCLWNKTLYTPKKRVELSPRVEGFSSLCRKVSKEYDNNVLKLLVLVLNNVNLLARMACISLHVHLMLASHLSSTILWSDIKPPNSQPHIGSRHCSPSSVISRVGSLYVKYLKVQTQSQIWTKYWAPQSCKNRSWGCQTLVPFNITSQVSKTYRAWAVLIQGKMQLRVKVSLFSFNCGGETRSKLGRG